MNFLYGKIASSHNFQDLAGVLRGCYRVFNGIQKVTDNTRFDKEFVEIISRKDADPTNVIVGDFGKDSVPETEKEEKQKPKQIEVNSEPLILQHRRNTKELIEKAIPSSQFSRAWNFGVLGASVIGNVAFGKMKSMVGLGSDSKILNERNAQKINLTFCKLRGAALKIGQALSIQEESLIPEPVKQIFAQAQEFAFVMPKNQMEQMMSEELGADWRGKFKSFEDKPFAAASIGQVHFAILKDNTQVAVKIQYPNVKESINSDMSNLAKIFKYTNFIPKTSFLDILIEHSKKELYEECDYLLEAQKQERYRNLVSDNDFIKVPKVFPEFSTERVIVSEFLQGDSIEEISLNYTQKERNRIGQEIMDLTLKEFFVFRFMQSDPNYGNFYFNRKDQKLILFDFGAAKEYSKKFCDVYIKIMRSALKGEKEKIIEYSKDLGFLNGFENNLMKETHAKSVMIIAEPFSSEKYDFGEQAITDRIYKNIPTMMKNRLKPPPPEIYSFHRKFSGAFLINIKLKTQINCKKTFDSLLSNYKFEY